MLVTIVSFVVVLSILVFVHELGHFIAARRSGIIVEELGFGYPPRVRTLFHWREIPVTLNAIPFGGFARMKGEDGTTGPGSFTSVSKRKRAATLLAGPTMNLLMAIVCFALAFMLGWPQSQPEPGSRIVAVAPGSPAEAAGIQVGDTVVQVDDTPLVDWRDLTDYTEHHLGDEVRLVLQRGEERLTVRLTPRLNPPPEEGAMGIAISQATSIAVQKSSVPKAILLGAEATGDFIYITLRVPVMLIQGLIPAAAARPIGPVGIAQIASDAVQSSVAMGWWFPVLQLMGILSAALAVTNLLPLPALDGGRLLFIVLEAVRGRRVAPEREGAIHLIGMALLLTVMILVTYQDIVSPIPSFDWNNFGL